MEHDRSAENARKPAHNRRWGDRLKRGAIPTALLALGAAAGSGFNFAFETENLSFNCRVKRITIPAVAPTEEIPNGR